MVGAASREARSLPPATPSAEGEEANSPVSPPTESVPAIQNPLTEAMLEIPLRAAPTPNSQPSGVVEISCPCLQEPVRGNEDKALHPGNISYN